MKSSLLWISGFKILTRSFDKVKSKLIFWSFDNFNLGMIGKVSANALFTNGLIFDKSNFPTASPETNVELIIEKLRDWFFKKLLT